MYFGQCVWGPFLLWQVMPIFSSATNFLVPYSLVFPAQRPRMYYLYHGSGSQRGLGNLPKVLMQNVKPWRTLAGESALAKVSP